MSSLDLVAVEIAFIPPFKKVKVKRSPCALTEHHARKAYWGVEV
jgi:hypothetical protein